MLTPAIYRTRITHLRRAPVHHYFEHRGYSWYVDVDELPRLPRWLRPFARFDARDHFGETDGPNDTLRQRIDAFLADRGVDLRGGRITALLQARVLGYVFNPISLYWCHDADGMLRHVIAEVHNTYGGRHAYLLPPDSDHPAIVMKKLYVSPFNAVDGHYLVTAPRARREPRRADLAAPREPARLRRHHAWNPEACGHRRDRPAATGGAGRAADGRDRNSDTRHHALAAARSRRARTDPAKCRVPSPATKKESTSREHRSDVNPLGHN